MKNTQRPVRSLIFSLLLAFAIPGVVLVIYSSCKKSDNCKGVVCQHSGSCAAGFCICPSGVGGDTCQNIYRKLYDNKYAGTANVNTARIGYTLLFSAPATSSNFLTMSLSIVKSATGATDIPALPIVLSSTSTSKSARFSITATTENGFTYTGNGILYAKTASLTFYKTPAAGTGITYICTDFILVP